MKSKIPVAVLGANGSVGQRFIQLLENHPWFEIKCLTGSDRSIGKPYTQSCHWVLQEPMPENAAGMTIQENEMALKDCRIAFSAMPADQAREVEPELASKGLVVVSNASAFRMETDVPILLPEINPFHTGIIRFQQKKTRMERVYCYKSKLHKHWFNNFSKATHGRIRN